MATKYWVGGAGTWDLSSTTHWSNSSGGASGATAPTATDDVVFDSLSNATAYAVTIASAFIGTATCSGTTLNVSAVTSGTLAVGQTILGVAVSTSNLSIPYATTITGFGTGSGGIGTYTISTSLSIVNGFTLYANAPLCQNLTIAGPLVGNVTFSGASALSISGSFSLSATGITWSMTGSALMYFAPNGTSKTINSNGITLANYFVLDGTTDTWTLSNALTFSGGAIVIQGGTFTTANFNTTSSFFGSNSSTAKTINLGSSTISMGNNNNPWSLSGSNLTFNSGTSTILMTGIGPAFPTGGFTYYNVTYNNVGFTGSVISGNSSTFNNLTFPTKTSIGAAPVTLSSSHTINGTLTTASTNATTRTAFVSATLGTPVTLTAAAVSLTDTDFRDITGAGAATWSGTRLGNALGNSGITFVAGKTVYWNLAGAQSFGATGWAPSSGGTPAITNFPLPQDTAVFDNTGSVTGLITIGSIWNLGTVDMSGRTSAMSLAVTAAPSIYGDWKNGTGVTLSGTSTISFYGRSTQTITSNAKAFTQPISILAFGGTVRLIDALTTGAAITTTLTNGTLDLNDQTLSTGLFSSTNSNTRAIAFGTGKITTTGSGTVWNTSSTTGFSYTGTSRVDIANNSATATTISTGSVTEANSLNFNFTTGSYTLTETTSVYKSLNFTGFSGTIPNSSRTIYGSLTLVSGMTLTAGANATTFAATSGTNTITTATKTLDFPITFSGLGGTFAFQDAFTQGSTRAFTITNGTVRLKASATSTVGAFATSGTTQKYLQSTTAGTQATLSQASGTVNASYLTIQDINATGGAIWNSFYTSGNTDAGNNTNWNFGATPSIDIEIGYRLRSLTQPRRF